MSDRVFFPLIGLMGLAAVALALVWPQGLGARSPGPFGHTPVQQTPEVQAAMQRAHEAAQKRAEDARRAVEEMQTETVAPIQ